MDDHRESYKAITLHILGSFQLLEFALKAYIGRAYSVIKKSVGETVHFGYSAKDIEEFPLERLLKCLLEAEHEQGASLPTEQAQSRAKSHRPQITYRDHGIDVRSGRD